jgi:hypothetical protein
MPAASVPGLEPPAGVWALAPPLLSEAPLRLALELHPRRVEVVVEVVVVVEAERI